MKIKIELHVKITGKEPSQIVLERAILDRIGLGEFVYIDWRLLVDQAGIVGIEKGEKAK